MFELPHVAFGGFLYTLFVVPIQKLLLWIAINLFKLVFLVNDSLLVSGVFIFIIFESDIILI